MKNVAKMTRYLYTSARVIVARAALDWAVPYRRPKIVNSGGCVWLTRTGKVDSVL